MQNMTCALGSGNNVLSVILRTLQNLFFAVSLCLFSVSLKTLSGTNEIQDFETLKLASLLRGCELNSTGNSLQITSTLSSVHCGLNRDVAFLQRQP